MQRCWLKTQGLKVEQKLKLQLRRHRDGDELEAPAPAERIKKSVDFVCQ
jgi:hypothetical protein